MFHFSDEYGARFSENERVKREIKEPGNSSLNADGNSTLLELKLNKIQRVGNKVILCQETANITAPGDRMGHVAARWIMIGGGISIVICGICIVVYYFRCQTGVLSRLRGDSFERKLASVVLSLRQTVNWR